MLIYPQMVKASVQYLSIDSQWYNTLWFFHPSGWVESDALALGDAISDWAAAEIMPYLFNGVELGEVVVYDMQVLDSWVVTSTSSAGTDGGIGGSFASLASCMTVTFKTNRRGRSYRGRNYISGFSETQVGAQFFEATAIAGIELAYENLPTAITGTGGLHVVASAQNGGVERPFGVHQTVTEYDANPRIYSQRNRTR